MEDLTNKVTLSKLRADEFIQPMAEIQKVITESGKTLTNADVNQLYKSIGATVSTKALALSMELVDGKKVSITSPDGGDFIMRTGAPVGTYNDNGGVFTGTKFTSGDGSSGLERIYDGGKVYVEFFGAIGDNVNNDTVSINLARDHCDATAETLVFSAKAYKFAGPLIVTVNFGIWSESGAQITAETPNPAGTHCFEFSTGIYQHQFYQLPRIHAYAGAAIRLYGANFVNIYCPLLSTCETGILMDTDAANTGCIDHTIKLGGITGMTNAAIQLNYVTETVFIQNNVIEANYVYSCAKAIYFNGSTANGFKVNENIFKLDAVDGAGSGAIGIHAPNGGLTGPMHYIFRNSFVDYPQFMDVGTSNGQTFECYFDKNTTYADFAIDGNANKFISANYSQPTVGAPLLASATINNRAGFNGGMAITANNIECLAAAPVGGMVAGQTFDCYIYSPFTSGDGAGVVYNNNIRITNHADLAVVPHVIVDNSGVNANEIHIRYIAIAAVAASSFVRFTVNIGY